MVYFSRNFNLKPALHNYLDLFKKKKESERERTRWIPLVGVANKRLLLYILRSEDRERAKDGKLAHFNRTSFLKHFSNNDDNFFLVLPLK